jgi:hypothetical protein
MTDRPDDDALDLVGRAAPGRAAAARLAPHVGTAAHAGALLTAAPTAAGRVDAVVPMSTRRRRTRRAVIGLAAASVLGIVAGGLSVLLPADTPGAPRAAVAAEIEQLALRTGKAPAYDFAPGTFLHTVEVAKQTSTDKYGDHSVTREAWIADDGSMIRVDTDEDGPYGRYYRATKTPNVNAPDPDFLDALPTDPAAMRAYLDARVQGSSSHEQAIFTAVRDMLRPGYGRPEVRAAALNVLSTLDAVSIEHDVALPSGRTGTGIVFNEPDQWDEYTTGSGTNATVIDPETTRILGEISYSSGMTREREAPADWDGTSPLPSPTTEFMPFEHSYVTEWTVSEIVDTVPRWARIAASADEYPKFRS